MPNTVGNFGRGEGVNFEDIINTSWMVVSGQTGKVGKVDISEM